jgi:hypothetical protein
MASSDKKQKPKGARKGNTNAKGKSLGNGVSPVLQVRVTKEQKAKVVRKGGSPYVRMLIDDDKE